MSIEKKSWEEFRATGLAWWINRLLHTFGWVIVFAEDEETGTVADVYAARTKWRGFNPTDEEEGFEKVTRFIANEGQHLLEEISE